MKGRIAILVPSFNGGALLAETVASIAASGLPADSYAILVSDNASTDGSAERLSRADAQGAPIFLHCNETNLGRVANWNKAMEEAEAMDFSHALFLMAGDVLANDHILALRQRMDRAGASLGIASYEVADETLKPRRIARRIRWSGNPERGIGAKSFLEQSFGAGAMLYGPLGANLYRLGGAKLRFDPADETHTDQLATAAFAQQSGAPLVYLDKPVSRWRTRPGRFHASMDPMARLAGDIRVIEQACRAAKVAPDYTKIRASLMLRAFFYSRDLAAAWTLSKTLTQGAQPSWLWLATLLRRQAQYQTPWLVEA